jgi:AraC-like DNA-binding protein
MNLKLETEKLREILKNFYNVSKIRTGIYDSDFNKIVSYPEHSCAFCTLMKSVPKSKRLCKENDIKAFAECKKRDSLYIYRCHAGLFEAVAPIKMNDLTLGYMILGQIKERGDDDEVILNYARNFIKDEDELQKACKRLHQRSADQIQSLASIMEVCTCYLWIAKLISVDEENLIFHLSNYINNNICSDLSVETLMDVFGISRSRLYDISHKYFGMSIAKYVKKKRVAIAKERLEIEGTRISEAADAAGFTDYNYFSKIFKSETGLTPGEYKKQALGNR